MKKAWFTIICFLFISLRSFATFTVTFNVVNASCPGINNGGITVSVTGGMAPYQYSISGGSYQSSNTFTGLFPANYSVSVIDALGDTNGGLATIGTDGVITSTNLNINACSNELPYLFNGMNINTAGVYMDTLTNVTGCDSIITLNLSVIPVIESTQSAQACSSQLPYLWNGQSYNAAGFYTVVLTASSGCDSIVNLFLFVTNTNEWIGSADTSWENPLNWSCGAIPGPTTDVVISSGTVVVHASTTINSLTVSPGATLTITTGINFVILH